MTLTRHVRTCFFFAIALHAIADSAIAQIVPSPKLPETTPWNFKALGEAPKFEWVDAAGPVRSLFYEGEPYGGKPTRVFAYYATPATLAGNDAKGTKYPAVVCVHGGGGTAFREWCELWAKRGYAAIAMDLAGYRPLEGKNAHQPTNRERLPDGGPNQGDDEKFGSIDKPVTEQWPYHAVGNVVRAHSLIRSFPEVDAERTAVTGISWGGYLTCIVAGVDNRFKAAVPVYGCGFLQDDSAWLARLENMSPEQRRKWVTLWDPSRYLLAVSMPIFFVNGTNDFAYPLDSYMKSFDAVPGEKQIRVTVNMPHGHPPGWAPQEIGLFVDQHLRGGSALPGVGEPKQVDKSVQAQVEAASTLKQAELHFTTEGGAINTRNWQSRPAKFESGTVTTDAPPADATAWFFTVTDERDATVSSRVVLPESKDGALSYRIGTLLQAGLPVRIVCLGDSVTGVYYHTGGRRAYTDMLGLALKNAYPRADVTMLNAGISGNTTTDGLARIDSDVLAHKPTLVTVMFGLNDLARGSLDAYRANLKSIIDKCRAAGALVLFCTPNNVITTSGRPTEKLEQFCEAMREVGRANNVPVCDCYHGLEALRQNDPLAWRMLLSDEIHPNMEGHKRIAELMALSIGGRNVSLDDVASLAEPLSRTLAQLKTKQPVKVLAMPPFDEHIANALKPIAPDVPVEVIRWSPEGKTLPQLEQDAKERVRALKPDQVIVAVPRSATADSTESFIHSYSWVMNWSLSFGKREWDCLVVHPSVADPKGTEAERDGMIRKLVRAQDLMLIDRAEGDQSPAADLFIRWIASAPRQGRVDEKENQERQ